MIICKIPKDNVQMKWILSGEKQNKFHVWFRQPTASQSTFGLIRFFFMFAKSKSLKIVLDRTHTHLCIKEEEGCLPCMRWFTLDVVLPITQFTLRTSFRFSLFFAILKFCMCVFSFSLICGRWVKLPSTGPRIVRLIEMRNTIE